MKNKKMMSFKNLFFYLKQLLLIYSDLDLIAYKFLCLSKVLINDIKCNKYIFLFCLFKQQLCIYTFVLK